MKEAMEILRKINKAGYESYIVGGAARDLLLKINTVDFDITTKALPKELIKVFEGYKVVLGDFLSVTLTYNKKEYIITTFRKEGKYLRNRTPITFKPVRRVKKDLKRRDFTINTLLINHKGKLVDYYHGKEDIDAKIIKTVSKPMKTFQIDALRILRAIRFAATLEFDFDSKTEAALIKKAHLVKKLSAFRRKSELLKILSAKDLKRSISLLKKYKIDQYLEIKKLEDLTYVPEMIGIFSQLDINLEDWGFAKSEKKDIIALRRLLANDLDIFSLLTSNFNLFSLAVSIKGEPADQIMKQYQNLSTKKPEDLDITSTQIKIILGEKDKDLITTVREEIFKNIIKGNLENEFQEIKKYIIKMYK